MGGGFTVSGGRDNVLTTLEIRVIDPYFLKGLHSGIHFRPNASFPCHRY